jgi:uncharacterized protein YutE (UPF0331/DUF86 family)
MVNRDLLALKLGELADRVARVKAHVPDSVDALSANRDALDLVAFNLMLAVQACADIASHMISDEGWPSARSLSDSFVRLRDQLVISPSTASALAKAVSLRNVVAHGYAAVDVKSVYAAATAGLFDLEAFAREVASYANRSATSG